VEFLRGKFESNNPYLGGTTDKVGAVDQTVHWNLSVALVVEEFRTSV